MNDSAQLRKVIAFACMFAEGKFEENDYPYEKLQDFKGLCINLLGESISPEQSELFKWLSGAGKQKRGKDNLGKFLVSFKQFLSGKLQDILFPQVEYIEGSSPGVYKLISFEEFKLLLPVFNSVDLEVYEEEINELMRLINKFNSIPNKTAVRYKSMWIVIQIALLVEAILPEIKKSEDDITCLKGVLSSSNDALNAIQQTLFFKASRTIAADFFSFLYNENMRIFLEHFSNLCAGKVIPDELYKICNHWNNDFARGRELIKFFRNDKGRQTRLFSQLGYFLHRANEFFMRGEEYFDECRMALLAVCGCSRFIHGAKISDLPYKSTEGLREIRKPLAHQPQFHLKPSVLYAMIAPVFTTIMARIADCEADAKKLGLGVNVELYKTTEKPNDDSESPRILKRPKK